MAPRNTLDDPMLSPENNVNLIAVRLCRLQEWNTPEPHQNHAGLGM